MQHGLAIANAGRGVIPVPGFSYSLIAEPCG